jgi:hypothetical protein
MTGANKEIKKLEILKAIKNSIVDARSAAQTISQAFKETVQPLRVEENESVFMNLTQNILDLQCFLEFIKELRSGMSCFDDFGLSADPVSLQDVGLNLFQEMHSAFATKDWIMLSDLIEYELSPLLLKEDEWLGALDNKLEAYEVQTPLERSVG